MSEFILLIEEDPLVQKLWKLTAFRCGKTVFAFKNQNEFLNRSQKFLKSTPIYIKNESEAQSLRKQGYQNVFITRGDINSRRTMYEPPPIAHAH